MKDTIQQTVRYGHQNIRLTLVAENPSVPDFVREPPLGSRPDRISELSDKKSPEYEEYDGANCEVRALDNQVDLIS